MERCLFATNLYLPVSRRVSVESPPLQSLPSLPPPTAHSTHTHGRKSLAYYAGSYRLSARIIIETQNTRLRVSSQGLYFRYFRCGEPQNENLTHKNLNCL